jgi:hypothetical protein
MKTSMVEFSMLILEGGSQKNAHYALITTNKIKNQIL